MVKRLGSYVWHFETNMGEVFTIFDILNLRLTTFTFFWPYT